MKAPKITDFSAIIGIDWADKKHDLYELSMGSGAHTSYVLPNKPDALHDWARSVMKRYPNKPVAVVCELKKGPLIFALSKYDHIVIFPVNPATVAKYRKAFTPSGAKDDPSDARIQTEILRLHIDKLNPIQAEPANIRALAQLTEYRRKLVQDRVDLTNRITAILKNYYPQALDWFKEKDTLIFCDFILKWSTLEDAKKARKQTLLNFFNQHNSRYPDVNQARIKAIKAAIALTDDPGVIEPSVIMMDALVAQLKLLIHATNTMDKHIQQRYRRINGRDIFDSFPGAGAQFAPRLMVAFGTNRNRYKSANELQKYAGIAPVTERSGQKTWVHWRYSCPTFLRQTFVEWAGISIRYSFWAQAYYQQQSSKGKPHNTIIRSLAFKWIRIAFRCWQTNTPYDESKYLESLKKRNSPLLKFAISN